MTHRRPRRARQFAAAFVLSASAAAVAQDKSAGGSSTRLAAAPATGPFAATTRPATTQAATRPADPRTLSSGVLLGQLLTKPAAGLAQPLQPVPEGPTSDATSGPGAVKPGAVAVATLREGTYVIDRVGRLQLSADGSQAQFVFEADGRSMREPPLIVVPSLKLMEMENINAVDRRDTKFRISGQVTEYRGRNYVLLEKVMREPEMRQQF